MWLKKNIGRAYDAEMNNLLTEEHLTKAFRNDDLVYRFMNARYSTLKLRLGITLSLAEEWELARVFNNPAQVDRLFEGVQINTQHTWIDDPAEREARYKALCDRLSDAISDTRYADRCRKESENARTQAYRELTGDRFWLRRQ